MSVEDALSILTGRVGGSVQAPVVGGGGVGSVDGTNRTDRTDLGAKPAVPKIGVVGTGGVSTALNILTGGVPVQEKVSPKDPFQDSNYLEFKSGTNVTPMSKKEFQKEQANKEAAKGSFLPTITTIGRQQEEYGKILQRAPEQDDEYQNRYASGESIAKTMGIDEKKVRYQGTNPIITPDMKKGLSGPDTESLFTYLSEKRKSSQAQTGKKIEEAGKQNLKYMELFSPYVEANLQDDIVKIQQAKPSIMNSLRTGNTQGAADEFVFDAFMSGDDVAIQKAMIVRNQLGQVAGEQQQEVKDEKAFGKELILSTAQMLPMMAKGAYYGMIPVVGPALSTSMWARQGAGEILADMEKEGVPRDVALPVALNAGLAYSLIESMQIGQIKNIGPIKEALNKPIKKKILYLVKTKGIDWVKENIEEINQSLIQVAAVDVAKAKAGIELDSEGLVKKYRDAVVETFKQSAGPMGLLSALGLGAGSVKMGYQAVKDKKAGQAPTAPTAPTTQAGNAAVAPKKNAALEILTGGVSGEKKETDRTDIGKKAVTSAAAVAGKTIKDFDVTDDEFWAMKDEEKRNQIFSQLPEDEQDRLQGAGQEDKGIDIEAVRKRVAEVDRDDDEKEAILNVNLAPSDGQKAAGNYKVAPIRKEGLNISIETPAGGIRKSKDSDPKKWSQVINHDYGYIKGTKGADGYRDPESGDQVDIFINPGAKTEGKSVYIVDQINPETGEFDEHKVMMGFDNSEEAKKAYLSNYEPGWKGLDAVTEMAIPDFKEWVYSENTKNPAKEYVKPGAKAPGSVLFHGTRSGNVIEKFNLDNTNKGVGSNAFAQGDLGVYLTSSETAAKYFSRKAGQRNALADRSIDGIEAISRATEALQGEKDGNVVSVELPSDIKIKELDHYPTKAEAAKYKAEGYDGLRFAETGFSEVEDYPTDRLPTDEDLTESKTTVIFDPGKIKVLKNTDKAPGAIDKKSVENITKPSYISNTTIKPEGAQSGTNRPQQKPQSDVDSRTGVSNSQGSGAGSSSGRGDGQQNRKGSGTTQSSKSIIPPGKKLSDFKLTIPQYWKLNKAARTPIFNQLTENEKLTVKANKPVRKTAGPATYAKVKMRLSKTEYNDQYYYQKTIHGLQVDFSNAMQFGFKTSGGVVIKGSQAGWMQDVAIVTGRRSIFKNLPKTPSENALRYLQSVVDAYSAEDAQIAFKESTGAETPTHTDDVIALIQEAKNKNEFIAYHKEFEKNALGGTNGSDATDDEFAAAEKVFKDSPGKLNDRQREILEAEWGMSVEDAAVVQEQEEEDSPVFARSRDINQMKMDLFNGGNAEQQQEMDLFQQITPKQQSKENDLFSNESGDMFAGTQFGDKRNSTQKEVDRIQQEKKTRVDKNYKGTTGLPLFDKNEQEAMATDQLDLFGKPMFARGKTVEADQINSPEFKPVDTAGNPVDLKLIDEYDFDKPLTHESGDKTFNGVVKKEGLFKGVFALGDIKGSSMGVGGYHHTYIPRKDMVAREKRVDIDDDGYTFLKTMYPDITEEQYDVLDRTILGDKAYESVIEKDYDGVNVLQDLPEFKNKSVSDIGWMLQGIRGQVAFEQGFDAVEMNDEYGTSYLIPAGSKTLYLGKIESYDDLERIKNQIKTNSENPDIRFAKGDIVEEIPSTRIGNTGEGSAERLDLPRATDERSQGIEKRLSASLHRFAGVAFDENNTGIRVLSPNTEEGSSITGVLQDFTGKEVVWFESDASLDATLGLTADGISFPRGVSPDLANKIFINVNSSRPTLWVAGHELWHFIEQNPKFNELFWNSVKVTAKGRSLLKTMAIDLKEAARSEFAADIVGEMITDPEFLEVLHRQNASVFDKIFRKLVEILTKLSKSLKAAFIGEAGRTKEYESLIENVDEVRYALARILSSYRKSFDGGRRVDVVSDVAAAVMQLAGPKAEVKPVNMFFSPLLQAVRGTKQEKGTGEQFFNMLTKAPGVKEAEWKWVGLDDFLKGKKSVTRGEIEEFVRGNEVVVEEVVKANYKDPRYSKYTLPGGENYREVLLTLPPKNEENGLIWVSDGLGNTEATDSKGTEWVITEDGDSYDIYKNGSSIDYSGNLINSLEKAKQVVAKEAGLSSNFKNYASSHWEEPNVIAHTRLNDRTGPGGERVLFVEEIQSDWEREAREKGVIGTNSDIGDASNWTAKKDSDGFWVVKDVSGKVRGFPRNIALNANDAINKAKATEEKSLINQSGVPNQPFLKNWQEVVLKRILRMAAEEGYDRVAWINGEQTADRYDLSKKIGRVQYSSKGKLFVDPLNWEYNQTLFSEYVPEEKIADHIGKDAAKKLIESPVLEGGLRKIEGGDLKFGGQWAFNLYDKMIPQFLNKYGKKWGTQVESVWLDTPGEQQSIKITPAMVDAVLYEGQPLFARSKSPLKSKEALQKAKADLTAEKERVAELEREMNQMKGRLLSLPQEKLLERAEINLKIKSEKLEELDQIKNLILQYAKNIGIDGVGYNKVAAQVSVARSVRGLEKAVRIMDQVWEGARRVETVESLEKVLEKEYRRLNKVASGKLKSTIAPEYNVALRKYLDELTSTPDVQSLANGATPADYKGWVDKMLSYYNNYAQKDLKQANKLVDLPIEIIEWMEDPSKPVPEKISQAIKYLFKHTISTMTTDELVKVLDDIESLKATGRTVKMAEDFARELELNTRAEAGAQVVKEATKDPSSSEETFLQAAKNNKLDKFGWMGKLAEKGLWSLIDAERMVEWLSGWKNVEVLKNSILKPLYAAEKTKMDNLKAAQAAFEKLHKDVDMAELYKDKLIEIDFKEVYGEVLQDYEGKESKISLTTNQGMFVYANSQNPGNRAHLIGMFGGEGIAENVIKRVVDALPEKLKRIVDAQIDWYDNVQYYRMNPVFLNEHEVPLPKEQRYFPIQSVKTDRAESAIVADYLARHSSKLAGVQKGMTKMRVHSQAPFKQMDYVGTVVRNILSTEHYIAYNDAIRDVSRFLNHKEVRAAIEDKNEEVYSQIKEWLKAVAYGRVGGSENILDKITDYMRGNFSTFALGLRLTTSLQQFASLPRGMGYLDKKSNLMKSASLFMKHPVRALDFAANKSGLMASRKNSYERELAESYEKGSVKQFAGLQNATGKLKEWAMVHIGLTDRIVATILWSARYQEGLTRGYTDAEAVSLADELIRKTQSRGGVLYMPAIYRGSGLSRAFMMFSSDLNQAANLLFEVAGKWNIQPTQENLTQIALFFMLPTLVIYLVNNALRLDEPEDYIYEFMHQFAGAVPFLGPIMDATVKTFLDEAKSARGLIPDKTWTRYAADLSPAPLQTYETLAEGIAKKDPLKFAEAGAQFTGVPFAAPKQYIQGAAKLLSGDVPNWRSLIWGKRKAMEKGVLGDMAKRLYSPRPKSDDTNVYSKWYKKLNPSEKDRFKKYLKEEYMPLKLKQEQNRIKK